MSADRWFNKGALVASFMYLLGLDREPEEETRSPRVIRGDPALCAELESSNRLANSSTNLVLSFYEWLNDREAEEIAHELVEDVLLFGVPNDDYAYSAVAHDEAFGPKQQKREGSARTRRTAIHLKIVNLRLRGGGFLQPFYAKLERMLTTLYLADLAIRKNLGSPLDPGRARNIAEHHRHGDISKYKRIVDEAIKAAKRLPDGTPDPDAVLMKFHELGHKEVFAANGLYGRQGVFVNLDDHPVPVRFFGAGFEELHQLINKKEGTNNERTRSHKYGPGKEFFPNGYLNRSPQYASRIAIALREWRNARAAYHVRKYNLERPTMVFGGFVVGADPGPFGGVGGIDYLAMEPKQRVESPTGDQGLAGDCQPDRAAASDAGKVNENPASTENSNESSEPGKTVTQERDPDLRGTHANIGISLSSIVGDAARILRCVSSATRRIDEAIVGLIEGRDRWTQVLTEAARKLGCASNRFGDANRGLGEAIGRFGFETGGMSSVPDFGDEDGLDPTETVRRVKRPLPTTNIEQAPSLGR